MPTRYLLHFPDGAEYGPIDLATLRLWLTEGRLPPGALVWPEGAAEWVTVDRVLGDHEAMRGATRGAALDALGDTAALPVRGPSPKPAPPSPSAPAGADAAGKVKAPVSPAVARPEPKKTAAAPTKATTGPAPEAAPTSPRPPAPDTRPFSHLKGGPAAPAGSSAPAAPSAPAAADDGPLADLLDSSGRSRSPRPAAAPAPALGPPSGLPRAILLMATGVALALSIVAVLWVALRPLIAKRRDIAAIHRHALADRRVSDVPTGLAVDLPPGWVALRPDNPYVVVAGGRLALAQPALGAFGALQVDAEPRLMGDLDRHLAAHGTASLSSRPSRQETGREEVRLGRGHGRLVRTTWDDGEGRAMQGTTLAWRDGFNYFTLDLWAPAAAGAAFASEVEALAKGVMPAGTLESRVESEVESRALEMPELSRAAVRLLVEERLSGGDDLDDLPLAGLRAVSRGLDVLNRTEAEEMRAIYAQIWAPVSEAERVRFARLMQVIKVGQTVPAEEARALRDAIKLGVAALPEEQKARLQELSTRAVVKARDLP